jgi:hypothetical protein
MPDNMGLQFLAGNIALKAGVPSNYHNIRVGCSDDLYAFCIKPPDSKRISL